MIKESSGRFETKAREWLYKRETRRNDLERAKYFFEGVLQGALVDVQEPDGINVTSAQPMVEATRKSIDFFGIKILKSDQVLIEREKCVRKIPFGIHGSEKMRRALRVHDRLEELGFTGFVSLVLPNFTLEPNYHLQVGEVQPPKSFFKLKKGLYLPNSGKLYEGIYLIETKRKPDYTGGDQKYENDGAMEELISDVKKTWDGRYGAINAGALVPDGSRFNLSQDEIRHRVMAELAYRIGDDRLLLGSERDADRAIVRPHCYSEFNIAGNMGHPQMEEGDTMEFFEDSELVGGSAGRGGLSHVEDSMIYGIQDRDPRVGFRTIIGFS